jgi:hypothetical protein
MTPRVRYAGPAPYTRDDRPYPQRTAKLPRELDRVDAAWLTGVMVNRYPGLVINSMQTIELRNGHTTKMRVQLDLNDVGRAAGIPEHVCLKSNWSGGFGHVDIHALEARFYHFVPPVVNLAVPASYFSDWDAGPTGQGLVVLEDLALAGGAFGSSTDHMGVDAVARGLEEYAQIHGRSWDHPHLAAFGWLPRSMDTPIDFDQLEMMWTYAAQNIAKPEYQALLPRWMLNDPQEFKRLYDALGAWDRAQRGPLCIVHGDSHQGNSYLRPDGTRIRIDWQLVRKGFPWRDLAYFMIGALTIEERRANERRLLAHYRQHLVATGAQDVASEAAIWDAYRRWPIYGCQAWIANMDEWGQQGYPMNERFFTALDDLGTVKLLNG